MTTAAPELRCHVRHLRAAKLCHRGSREWAALNGIAWPEFIRDGVPASRLTATGDPIVARVVEAARREAGTHE